MCFFNAAISGLFFAFLGPIRHLRDELKTTTTKIERKLEANQKVIIFFVFFNVFNGLPKPKKKTSKFKHPKKGPKTCQDIAKPKTPIFTVFSKRDTDREKVGKGCFLKGLVKSVYCQKTKMDGF
jgi:hypothetical protein